MDRHPVLFIPGMMLDARMYEPQIAALGRLYPVQVVDITQGDSIETLARVALASAPHHFALVGMSMGGIVALEMYRQEPERITHLALLNTTPLADNPMRAPVRKAQMAAVGKGELLRVLKADIEEKYLTRFSRSNDGLRNGLLDMGLDLGADVFRRQSIALLRRRDARDVLPTIRCPTLVLCGSEDQLCSPAIHEDMAAAIHGAKLVMLAKIGHISTLESPVEVSDALAELLNRKPMDPA